MSQAEDWVKQPRQLEFLDGSEAHWNGSEWSIAGSTTKPMKDNKPVGTKLDTGKVRWSLLPAGTISMVLQVLEFGAAKYSVDNWQHVVDHERRYYDAAMRHISAWLGNETNDPESGLPHLAHAVCCLLYLMWFDKEKK